MASFSSKNRLWIKFSAQNPFTRINNIIMCIAEEAGFFQKKSLKVLPVSGIVVPLHPQTRGDRLGWDGRDSDALPREHVL